MYKSGEGVWTAPDGGSTIDVGAKVVTATTTHFSEWGVFSDRDEVYIGAGGASGGSSMLPAIDHSFEMGDGTKLIITGTADTYVSLRIPHPVA